MEQPGLFDSVFAAQDAIAKAEAEAVKAAEMEATRDHIGERLIALGFAQNEFLLGLNGGCGAVKRREEWADPWNLPSRLFMWPIQTRREERKEREIWMSHPDIGDHPAVVELRAAGFEVADRHPFEWQTLDGEWKHAMDLATDAHWRDLIRTNQYASPAGVASGVDFQLSYKRGKIMSISTSNARLLLESFGLSEPSDRLSEIMKFDVPRKVETRWPIGRRRDTGTAWGLIHGIEDGWLGYQGEFLGWTPKGCNMRGAPQQKTDK